MKKALIIVLIISLLFISGCTKLSNISSINNQNGDSDNVPQSIHEENNSIHYVNNKLKFSLDFPESWKGKYKVNEYEKSIEVIYDTDIAKQYGIYFFGITYTYKSDWKENTEAPVEKISESNGLVYYAFFPTEAPFDMSKEDERKDGDKFDILNKDTENILKTFCIIE